MASKKVYIKTYKEFLKETVHYKVNADKINVLTYDKKGKLSEEKVFKGLTKEEKKLDVRVIAATNRHLEQEVGRGAFRGEY